MTESKTTPLMPEEIASRAVTEEMGLEFIRQQKSKTTNEQKYFDALKRITKYQTPDQLKRRHWKDWGLEDASEAIEMSYENIQQEARDAIKGKRRPHERETLRTN